jgi:Tol biopolymer transport system component
MRMKAIPILFFSAFLLCMCGTGNDFRNEPFKETDFRPEFLIEGQIIFQSNFDGDNEIYLISGMDIKKLTDNSWDDEYPLWSPDGKKIAFMANPEGNYDIFIMNSDGSAITPLTSFSSDEKTLAWFPDGRSIVYTREVKKFIRKELSLFRIDIHSKKTKRIIPGYNKGHAIPHVSPAEPLLTFTAKKMIGWDVAVYDMDEQKVTYLDEGGKTCRARFSPDGKKLVYVSNKEDKKGEIFTMNPDGSQKARLTERNETYDYFPCWSPDGQYIAFNSSHQGDHNGDWKLFILEMKSRKISLLFDSPGNDVFPDWHLKAPQDSP